MKEWTREERYRELKEEDLDDLQALHETVKKSRWRSAYHVQPVTGLMGDTNGFSLFINPHHRSICGKIEQPVWQTAHGLLRQTDRNRARP